jgi:hypothetical protein
VVERRQDLRFPFESGEPIGIGGNEGGEYLHGDVAIQSRVAGAIHLSHPTRSDELENFVDSEAFA